MQPTNPTCMQSVLQMHVSENASKKYVENYVRIVEMSKNGKIG